MSQAELVWAVPSHKAVQVCITLKGETSILMLSKDGVLRKKVDLDFFIRDAGSTFIFLGI